MENRSTAGVMDLQALPENCIANVISLTTPRDACRMSLISKRFNSAANSNDAWERFLPPQITLSHHSEGEAAVNTKSKKELYFTVCDKPFLIDEDQMSISVEKGSGKKYYMISARRLQIAWSNGQSELLWKYLPESRPQGAVDRGDPLHLGRVIQDALPGYRFLRRSRPQMGVRVRRDALEDGVINIPRRAVTRISFQDSRPRSRFKEAAYLHNCSCLEIRGRIEMRMLSPWTMYKAYLVYYLSRSTAEDRYRPFKVTVLERAYAFDYNRPDLKQITAHWISSSQKSGYYGWSQMSEKKGGAWCLRKRESPRLEIELGEFYCRGDEDGGVGHDLL